MLLGVSCSRGVDGGCLYLFQQAGHRQWSATLPSAF
jgi:hypothetical protein